MEKKISNFRHFLNSSNFFFTTLSSGARAGSGKTIPGAAQKEDGSETLFGAVTVVCLSDGLPVVVQLELPQVGSVGEEAGWQSHHPVTRQVQYA